MSYKKARLSEYLECAKIVNTHGVRGTCKLECRADSPEILMKLKSYYVKTADGYRVMKAKAAAVQKGFVLVTFEGINSVEDAIKLKDTVLYTRRGDIKLDAGSFYIADIIGLPVYDEVTKTEIGTLADVLAPVGQQVYVIKKPDGKSFMVPCVPEFIKKVSFGEDCDCGVYVTLIEGMDEV